MTPDQHFWALKQNHEVSDETYYIQLAATFELNSLDLIHLFEDAKAAGYNKNDARTIVLAQYNIIPYETYLRCYVLSGTGNFRLKTSGDGSGYVAASAAAPAALVPTAGSVETVPNSLDGMNEQPQ